jgi:hypothetical protein
MNKINLRNLKTDLVYIYAYFSFLSQSITKVEKTTHFLSETRNEINDMQDNVNKINGSEADVVKQKFRSWFCKNKGFKIMRYISHVLGGEYLVDSGDMKDLGVSDMVQTTGIMSCGKYILSKQITLP